MDLLDQIHRTAFLGPEFLSWLWYRADKTEGEFALYKADGTKDTEFGPFELWFEDKLVVGSHAVDAQENSFKGGQPADSLEAHTALRLGKQAHEAKLRIVRGGQEWTFLFKALAFQVSGVKIPAVLSKEDDDRFYERMFLLEQLDQMVKGLFSQFLKRRLSPEWDAELTAIQAWVRGERPPVAQEPMA